jgi:hypothetical protein
MDIDLQLALGRPAELLQALAKHRQEGPAGRVPGAEQQHADATHAIDRLGARDASRGESEFESDRSQGGQECLAIHRRGSGLVDGVPLITGLAPVSVLNLFRRALK